MGQVEIRPECILRFLFNSNKNKKKMFLRHFLKTKIYQNTCSKLGKMKPLSYRLILKNLLHLDFFDAVV